MCNIYFVFFSLLCFAFLRTCQSRLTTTKIGPPPIWNSTHTDKLRQDLLLNYDKFARPAQHYNTTTVQFGITINHIELDEFKSTLTVHAWVKLIWTDEKLKWNSEDYGGLSLLHLADHEIWQPDLFLYNSATGAAINHYGNTHFVVSENGEVLWVPPAQFVALCQLDLKYWPFDTQKCFLKFGSWTYHGDQIDLKLTNDSTYLEILIPNSEWLLTNTHAVKTVSYYKCCAEPYPDITVHMTLTRISPSYKAIILTPAFVIIILTLINFWLPPDAGEKIVINSCTAVMICIFMLYFTQKLPAMGNHTPLIVLFYSTCLYLVGFSMIISVLVIWISRTKHSSSLPWIIKRPLTGTFGKLLSLQTYMHQTSISTTHRVTAEEMRDTQVTDFDEHNGSDEHHIIRASIKTSIQHDWVLLAAAIDRLAFCFYCLLFAVLSLCYSL